MWYRIKMGACDAGREPVLLDSMTLTGGSLEDLMEQIKGQLLWATDATRSTGLPALRGVLHAGLQVEVWASSRSCAESGSVAEDCLRVIQTCALRALSSGGCSPRPPTQTAPYGCQLN